MSENEADKVIREYVRANGRVALREGLNDIAKDYPGNENAILSAGLKFLRRPTQISEV